MEFTEELQRAAAAIRGADALVIAAGAGIGVDSGLPDFRVANLLRDRKLLELARQEAARFVESGEIEMSRASVEIVWAHLKAHWQRHYGLVEAG